MFPKPESKLMRLLTDHDVYKITVDFLMLHGHDVVTAKELGIHKATDKELLEKYTEKDLKTTFCVVEPHRYRIRRVDK